MSLEESLATERLVWNTYKQKWCAEHGLADTEWEVIEENTQTCIAIDKEKLQALRRGNNFPVQEVRWKADCREQFSRINHVLETAGLSFRLVRCALCFKGTYMLHINSFYMLRT